MRKILKTDEIKELEQYVGAECYTRLVSNRHLCCRTERGGILLAFHFCDIHSASQKEDKVCIYCCEQDLVFVCDNKKCLQYAETADQQPDPYRWLLAFFLAMTADDVYQLEKMEDKITGIEDGILSRGRKDDCLGKIITMRRSLLKLKRYYEQLSLVTSDLADDEDCLLPQEMQKRFAAFDRRVDHLICSVMHLREYITQVREAYQAQIDISQNQTMKVLTVVSAVFLPLTLIVGWFGMNLQMPEYSWQFGYVYVIVLSAVVCFFCLAIFKFKKWY